MLTMLNQGSGIVANLTMIKSKRCAYKPMQQQCGNGKSQIQGKFQPYENRVGQNAPQKKVVNMPENQCNETSFARHTRRGGLNRWRTSQYGRYIDATMAHNTENTKMTYRGEKI